MQYKIIKSFRKTLVIQIKNGEVIVRSPNFTTKRTIENFLEKHKEWIEKKLEKHKNIEKISLSDEDIKKYKKSAYNYIPLRVNFYANKFGLNYNKIKVTNARTRWGSCSSKKNLNFSYRLMISSKEAIDYVIIHELSHLKYMNHSKKFWEQVELMMPDYKKYEKELKGLNIS